MYTYICIYIYICTCLAHQTKDFNFQLPDELIARFPAEGRDSRLLLIEGADGASGLQDLRFENLPGGALSMASSKEFALEPSYCWEDMYKYIHIYIYIHK